jgi:NAD+ synthase
LEDKIALLRLAISKEQTLNSMKILDSVENELFPKNNPIEGFAEQIVQWLKDKITETKAKGFVVGVSGGVDSALVSTLCAKTDHKTICLELPIHQAENQLDRGHNHIMWLKNKYKNVSSYIVNLTDISDKFVATISNQIAITDLAIANARSRLRMVTLYFYSNIFGYLVAGTGNAVEDLGIFFFSKFGDGGVDCSPIGDLLKSEVRALAKYLGIADEIVNAVPTDGLFGDNRSDEDQIGASYDELEWAMKFKEDLKKVKEGVSGYISPRQSKILKIYDTRHEAGKHKMEMPPICKLKRN